MGPALNRASPGSTMARTKIAPAAQPGTPATPWAPGPWLADWTRQQAVVTTETLAVLRRGFDTLRQIQQDAARQASERHARAAKVLSQPCAPERLLALQADLLRQDVEAATRAWQQVADAALETNTELLACTLQLVDTEDVFAAARGLHS